MRRKQNKNYSRRVAARTNMATEYKYYAIIKTKVSSSGSLQFKFTLLLLY